MHLSVLNKLCTLTLSVCVRFPVQSVVKPLRHVSRTCYMSKMVDLRDAINFTQSFLLPLFFSFFFFSFFFSCLLLLFCCFSWLLLLFLRTCYMRKIVDLRDTVNFTESFLLFFLFFFLFLFVVVVVLCLFVCFCLFFYEHVI